MNRLAKWLIGIAAVLCALFAGITQLVLPALMDRAVPYVEKMATDYIHGSATIGSISKSGFAELLVKDVIVKDKKQQPVAVMPETRISLNPLKLLGGIEKVISSVEMKKPVLYIRQDKDETWNFQSLLKHSDSETTPFYGKAEVKQGSVVVQLPEGTWEYDVNGSVDGSYNPAFDLDFTVDAPGMETARFIGSIDNKGIGKIVMRSSRVDLAPYGPLALRYGQVEGAAGQVTDIDGQWDNDGSNTVLRGTCNLQDVRGSYSLGGQTVPFRITGKVSSSDHAIRVKDLMISLNGQKALVSGTVDIRDTDNPEGQVSLRADTLSYAGETVSGLLAEMVLADRKAAVNLIQAIYRGGIVNGQGTYDLSTGRISGEAGIRKVTLDGEQTSGEKILLNAVLAGSGTYDRERGILKVSVAANTMDLQWRDTILKVMDFDADLTDTGVRINTFSAFADHGAMTAAGTVGYDGTYDLKGRMTDMPIAPALAVCGQEGSGLLTSDWWLFGRGSRVNFEGPVRLRQAVWKDLAVEEGLGEVTVRDNVVTLKDYRLVMEQGTHLTSGTIDLRGDEPAFDLAVDTEKVRIEPLIAAAGWKDSVKVTGNLSNHMLLTGPLSDPTVKGNVDMSDGSVQGYLVDSAVGGYVYHKGELTLQNIIVKALSTTLKLHGYMDAKHNLDFQAEAENVYLERLPLQEENIKLSGYASAEGHLGGTMEKPLFAGNVTSEEFRFNDVPVKNLKGSLISNGNDINSLKGSCEQENTDGLTSAYMIDLSLNLPARSLTGRMGIMYGDLQNIMKMAKVDFPLKGLAAGTLEFNGPGKGVLADFWGYKLDINGVKYDQMAVKALLNKGVLTIDTIKLQEDRAFRREGTISLTGMADLRKRQMQIKAEAVDANPAILTAFMKKPLALAGSLNMTAHLEGSMDSPVGTGVIELTGGNLEGASFDRGIAEVSLEKDVLTLKRLTAEKDIYYLNASGKIPMDLFRDKENRKNPNAQMDILTDFSHASLAVLGTLPAVEWGVGEAQGNLRLTGTLEDPQMFGSLGVTDGCVKLANVYTLIDKLNLKIVFDGSRIVLEQVSAVLGKGTVEGSGTYDLKANDEKAYLFSGTANNAEIDSPVFKGRINGTFSVMPEYYRLPRRLSRQQDVKGNGTDGNPVEKEGWRAKVKADVRLDDVLVNMPTVPSLGEGSGNLGMDVAVSLGPKVHLYNKYLYDLWLKGQIHMKGSTILPRIEGSIETDKGTVTYLRTRFNVEKGSVRWSERGTFLPAVKLDANTKFNRYRIELHIEGPLSKDNLNLVLRSNPTLSQDALVRMLTLQRSSAGSDDLTNEDMQNLLIAGLETGILGDVEQIIRKALGIDEFRLYAGKVENGVDFDNQIVRELTQDEKEQYNFLIAKNLTERWKIGYTRSFNGMHDNIYTQYQLTDHLNLTLSQNEDHERRYSIEYHITF